MGVKIAVCLGIFLNDDRAGVAFVELDGCFLIVSYFHLGSLTIESHGTINRRTLGIHLYIRIVERNGNDTVFYFANTNSLATTGIAYIAGLFKIL